MDPSSLILDLERSFAPLTCRVEARGPGHVAVRLVDRKGQQTRPYTVELRQLALPANRDAWVEGILSAIERDGFRPAHQQAPAAPVASPVRDNLLSLKGMRAALSRSMPVPPQVSRFFGGGRGLVGGRG